MYGRPGETKALSQILLKWRWWIMGWCSLTAILLEVAEKTNFRSLTIDYEFVSEVILEGILIPLLGVFILGVLQKAMVKEFQVKNTLAQKDALDHLINTASSWDELLQVIVEFPRGILPVSGAVLMLYASQMDRYETARKWGFYGGQWGGTTDQLSATVCDACQDRQLPAGFHACQPKIHQVATQGVEQYCLPLVHAGSPIALLFLFISSEREIHSDEAALLNDLGSIMARALHEASAEKVNHQIIESVDAERRQIARDLHDNMAQNLLYMRNKFDALLETKDPAAQLNIHQDLQRMREITEEVYLSLRSTLKEIEGNTLVNLDDIVREYLQTLKSRVSFEIHFFSNGDPRSLQMRTARQVLYIIGELLANTEKHAEAHRVEVDMIWTHDGLTVSVCDDGKGSEDHLAPLEGHIGKSIMRERAAELKGKLEISSKPKNGTQAVLWLPVHHVI